MAKDSKRPSGNEPGGSAAGDAAGNFIWEEIDADLAAGRVSAVQTRFPPEPNGYMHIGHVKAFSVNFTTAEHYAGHCNLRFDDTNPEAEESEFVDAIARDIRWMGFDWGEECRFASDYFEQLYAFAIQLIEAGKAYVDSCSGEDIRALRGNFYQKGKNSPYRNRSVEENLELLERMRAGEFSEGEHVLRAKIDMESPDLNMRDPLMYRVLKSEHHRTGDRWNIYPLYDFAHGLSDAIEGVTHSLCSLEFRDHRPLYDWFVDNIGFDQPPRQIEFARLKVSYTVLSKRKLQRLVKEGHVGGWDDPRMPTLSGMRRRGYAPEAIRAFVDRTGMTTRVATVDIGLLEHSLREDLNARALRRMAVLRPLRVVIDNYPAQADHRFELPNHPQNEDLGTRSVGFGPVIYIERDDFAEDPPPKWKRLAPGREVRLRGACLVTCDEVVKNVDGEIEELRCRWDPDSLGGRPADGRKVKGTLHWVAEGEALPATVRLYDRLFLREDPDDTEEDGSFLDALNPDALEVLEGCLVEPAAADHAPECAMQFERLGYFCLDSADSAPGALVFNRTISLRDTWAKSATPPKR